MSTALSELGPVLPSRTAVYQRARELEALAKRAVEFAARRRDRHGLELALTQFDRMRAVLGGGDG